MKRVLPILLTLTILLALFCACGQENAADAPSLVGAWTEKDGSGNLYFANDKTGTAARVSFLDEAGDFANFTYQTENDTLRFENTEKQTVSTTYVLQGDTLKITLAEAEFVYVRAVSAQAGLDGKQGENDPSGAVTEPSQAGESTAQPTQATAPETDAPTQATEPEPSVSDYLLGSWQANYGGALLVYTFNADGTGTASLGPIPVPITYTVADGVITVTASAFGDTDTGSASYDATTDTLTLVKESGDTLVMTRVS